MGADDLSGSLRSTEDRFSLSGATQHGLRERRRLMKQTVKCRHHGTSAHADYLRHLRLKGSAPSHFSAGESLAVGDGTPPVFLSRSLSSSDVVPPPPALHPPAKSKSFHHTTTSAADSSPANLHLPFKTVTAGVSATRLPTHSISGSSTSSSLRAAQKVRSREF
ncbi:hypothetical protein EJ110_NYTH03809 [Nymphaea thermarum]|nr:hypothetical protein EJ110_NYTH03809 [Nymphaea thermarum]